MLACAANVVTLSTAAADGSTQQTLINQDRSAAGLAPLLWSSCLAAIAQQNADRMAAQGYISHTNGVTLDLGCGINATQSGENVAYMSGGINDVQANSMFMNSPEHKANILGPFNYVATAWTVAPNGYAYIAEEFLAASGLSSGTGGMAPGTGWESLGGSLSSGPDAASWGSGRLDVFARCLDGSLCHKWFDGTSWSGWESLGGQLTSDPTAVSWASGRIDVFARGTDRGLWHKWFDAGTWSGWQDLGGVLASGPDVASWGPRRLDVFAECLNGTLCHKWFDGSSWSAWESLGGRLTGDPTAVSWGSGRIDVFTRRSDATLAHLWFGGSGWGGWQDLGGALASGPDAASWGIGRLDVFGECLDGSLCRMFYDSTVSTWSAWQSQSSAWQWSADAGAVSPAAGRADVFMRGNDGAIWHKTVN